MSLTLGACGSSGSQPATTTHGPSPALTTTTAPTGTATLHDDTAAVGGCPAGTAPCVTTDVAVHPRGSRYIDANLLASLSVNHPELKHPQVDCPASTAYPVSCRFSAGHDGPVRGTLKVLGVEVRTRTYAYAITYHPVGSGAQTG